MKLSGLGAQRWALPLMLAAALQGLARAQDAAAAAPAASAASAAASAAPAGQETDAPEADVAPPRSKKDPFEPFNRTVFSFNEALDRAVLKPFAQAYKDILPEYVRTLIDNLFGNVNDAWSTVNQLLQGKVGNTLEMGMRVVINTGLGFGGLLDISSEIGLEKKTEDFGQTLGRWGVPSGPYVMLPVFGPSTVRDTVALPIDWQASPSQVVSDVRSQRGIVVLQAINTRAGLLGASKVLEDIALDKYSFLRDAYLTRRQNQVYDGEPPEEPDEEGADAPAPKDAPANEPAK